FFFSSRRRHTRFSRDWSSDVCSSDLVGTNNKILLEKLAEKIIAESKNYISEKTPSSLVVSKREQELGYLGLDSTLFEEDFHWKPEFSIDDSIKSVFDFYSKKNTNNGEH